MCVCVWPVSSVCGGLLHKYGLIRFYDYEKGCVYVLDYIPFLMLINEYLVLVCGIIFAVVIIRCGKLSSLLYVL